MFLGFGELAGDLDAGSALDTAECECSGLDKGRGKKNLTHLKCLAAVLAPKGVQTFALNYLFRELFKKKSAVKEEIFRQGNKKVFSSSYPSSYCTLRGRREFVAMTTTRANKVTANWNSI